VAMVPFSSKLKQLTPLCFQLQISQQDSSKNL
jgi:hypothetical protein